MTGRKKLAFQNALGNLLDRVSQLEESNSDSISVGSITLGSYVKDGEERINGKVTIRQTLHVDLPENDQTPPIVEPLMPYTHLKKRD